ncbi:hypothetical protein GF312_06565 [Candidatus Poribacteria bacterium]|nr:hypothetical protein [Candidatus Poribacteria bacterium]
MFVFFSRYKIVIMFVLLCTLSLVFSWLTVQPAYTKEASRSSLKHSFSTSVSPVFYLTGAINNLTSKLGYVGRFFVSIVQKPARKEEIEELKMQVENLKRQLKRQFDINRQLKQEIKLYTGIESSDDIGEKAESSVIYDLLPARVIAVEPSDWFRYVTINKGYKNGVRYDMPVVTRSTATTDTPYVTGAVVGKIVEVYPRSSRVRLVTDRQSVVSVTIESLGDLVLLRGQPDTEKCVIDEIPSTAFEILKEGDPIVVDERSPIFPPGMLVGNISSIEKGTHFCPIEVQPAFKFSRLSELMVVLKIEQREIVPQEAEGHLEKETSDNNN